MAALIQARVRSHRGTNPTGTRSRVANSMDAGSGSLTASKGLASLCLCSPACKVGMKQHLHPRRRGG